MVVLEVGGLLRRPSLAGSVHIHDVVAKKRDASTYLLRRLHAHMLQHNVGFIGGDLNMSAFSTVGDVFTDPVFSAPGNFFLWALGALEDSNRECAGFLIMPKRPYEWRVDSHGCHTFNNADLALGPRDTSAHLPVFLHLRTTNFPGPDSITRSLRNHSLCEQLHQVRHPKSCKSTRRESRTSKLRSDCSQIEGKSETPTEGIFWHDDHSI